MRASQFPGKLLQPGIQLEEWLRRGLVYSILTITAVGGYALIVYGVSLIFTIPIPADHPLLIGAFVLSIAILFEPLRQRLQNYLNASLFRDLNAYENRLDAFSRRLATAQELNDIGAALRVEIQSALSPDRLHIYVFDLLNDQYRALPAEDGLPSSDIRFSGSSPLVQHFQTGRYPLELGSNPLPPILESEGPRLAILDAEILLPLSGRQRLTGWLALGAPPSGRSYTGRELSYLRRLCDQTSVAFERQQTLADLDRRLQEMNALARVSRGVNVTRTYDDVLELIYAQTSQIMPASNFHITLYNKVNDIFYYGFCVEKDERLTGRENTPFPATTGLSPQVIRNGRPILTQDYQRECLLLGLTPATAGLTSWAGVPLNAGAETIGALSVGIQESGAAYTRGQLGLLQAIADQTAGAIVKARLLQETQARARQLSTLNEITRQLTSTLELEPLLRTILQNAVNILDCEAGILFLLDEQTDELEFKANAGPAAAILLGERLGRGPGTEWQVVQSRLPVMINQVSSPPEWFQPARHAGFEPHALLAVPLLSKERVIGVLEVFNRTAGLPFVEEDQTLLLAFAGQGAVAIENARLYTLTDLALAARVEELSVMQRIDRELNASLESERAMRITLDWAMRQTQAVTGLVGLIEEGKLQVVAQHGYDGRLEEVRTRLLELVRPALQGEEGNVPPLSPGGAHSTEGPAISTGDQVVIPIRREDTVIGVLLLEGTRGSQTDLAFLNRLSDHAAIAISNAQLYAEVQRAVLAKSDFVSFVAHELKNPMTSIKGYTELLAAGKVGQINDMQSSFLSTIRSNVDRMATLVSDLNDNSKIEADRLRLEYTATDAAGVVDEVVRSSKGQIEEKNQILSLVLPERLPPVWADRVRLAQVLTNLISNAHKYTPDGGSIEVGAQAVSNKWDPDGATHVLHIWVQDSGIGIGPDDKQKIFQKFFRSEDSKAREAPGSGLGLNITRSLVEMQGGRIWFESEFRKGTTFHFTIPIAEG